MAPSITRVAAEVLRAVPRKRVSWALGRLADLNPPAAVLDPLTGAFIRAYNVDLSEAEVPEGGFTTFNAFFTRRLKPGARPIDSDTTSIVSPADGLVADCGPITDATTFYVKGQRYDVGTMLGDPSSAAAFAGGWYAIIYLSPRDYHRVHAPVAGRVRVARHVPGTLYPVNSIGMHVPQLFARNERVAVMQSSPIHGEVASVMVGATGVGRMVMSFDESLVTNKRRSVVGARSYGDAGPDLERGGELGVFELGSTVVLFTQKSSSYKPVVVAGETVRMGQALVRKAGA